jgi:hypothetical protein
MRISLRVQRRSRVARLPLLAPENIEPCNDDDCRATECEGIRDIAKHQKTEHDRPEEHRHFERGKHDAQELLGQRGAPVKAAIPT